MLCDKYPPARCLFEKQGTLSVHELAQMLQVQGVIDPGAVYGAGHKAGIIELAHMMVDGVPGQAEVVRQFLAVGRVIPEVQQDLQPGPVRQQVESVAELGHAALGIGHGAKQELPQNAAVNGHAAVLLGTVQKQVGTGA